MSFKRYALLPKNPANAASLKKLSGKNIVYPLDEMLGIDSLPFKATPRMMLEIAYWAVKFDSYQETEEYFRNKCGIVVSDDTIRKIVNYIGEMVFQEDVSCGEEAMARLQAGQIEYAPCVDGTLYILADGSMLNTRRKDEAGSTWRENKLGMVFSTDHMYYWKAKNGEQRHRIEKREYISLLGTAGDFKKLLFHTAVRNGYGRYKNVVLLSDGAAWIRNMKEEVFPDAQQILDKFHAKENTYKFAKALFPNKEEQAVSWAEHICGELDEGKWESVIKELEPYKEKTYGPGTVNLYTYLDNNRENINYPMYEAKGYFVGSGAIESGNKVAVQDRLKLPGMRWNEETAQYVLSIKGKIESKLWEKETVPMLLKKMGVPI